nr:uncharacterized protein LOC100184753 isoform X1 [Ciona intestinalis]|eukprot:XP_009860574.2 uncharacterized protein LOC100184753 isoform X1 [Ciona intestinalis]
MPGSEVGDFTILAQQNRALPSNKELPTETTSLPLANSSLSELTHLVSGVGQKSHSPAAQSTSQHPPSTSDSKMSEKSKFFYHTLGLLAVNPDPNDAQGCHVSKSRAVQVASAIDESYSDRPPLKHYSQCSCTALNETRGFGRARYTIRDLLDALDCISNGFPTNTVAYNFDIPRFVITSYTSGVKSLMIKHHSDCGLFLCGKSVIIHGPAHHLKAMEENRRLRIYGSSTENNKSMKKITTPKKLTANLSPVVVLEQMNKYVSNMKSTSESEISLSVVTDAWNYYLSKGSLKYLEQYPEQAQKEGPVYENKFQEALKALVLGGKMEEVAEKFCLPVQGLVQRINFFAAMQGQIVLSLKKRHNVRSKHSDRQMFEAIDEYWTKDQKRSVTVLGQKYGIPPSTLRGSIDRNEWVYKRIKQEMPAESTIEDRIKKMILNRNLFIFLSSDRSSYASKQEREILKRMMKQSQAIGKKNITTPELQNAMRKLGLSPTESSEDFRMLKAMDDAWKAKIRTCRISERYNIPMDTLRNLLNKNRRTYFKLMKSLPSNAPKGLRLRNMNQNKHIFYMNFTLPQSGSTDTENIADQDQNKEKNQNFVILPDNATEESQTLENNENAEQLEPSTSKSSKFLNRKLNAKKLNHGKGFYVPISHEGRKFRTHRWVDGKLVKKNYTYSDLMKALKLIKNKSLTIAEAGKTFNIPFTTLRDNSRGRYVKVDAARKGMAKVTKVHKHVKPKSLKEQKRCSRLKKKRGLYSLRKWIQIGKDAESSSEESSSVAHISKIRQKPENVMLNLTVGIEGSIADAMRTLRKWNWSVTKEVAREMITIHLRDDLKYSRSKEVTELWLKYFCVRNHIVLEEKEIRTDEPDPFVVYGFLDKLEGYMRELALEEDPYSVYCIHEVVLNKDEENETTVIAAVSAAGDKQPPMIIFQGEVAWCSGERKTPFPGTQFGLASKPGVPAKIFEHWFKNFLTAVSQRPLLLLYDGSYEHLPIGFINNHMNSNIRLIKLPYSNTKCSFELPYGKVPAEAKLWFESSKTSADTKYTQGQITNIVTDIWQEGFTEEVITSQFTASGIFPTNHEKYPTDLFPESRLREYSRSVNLMDVSTSKKRPQASRTRKSYHADSADSTKVSRQKVTVKRLQKGQSNKNQDDPLRGVKKSATTKLSKPVVATLLGHLNQSDVDACEGNKDPLFIAYCKKHKPAVSAQKPELTPEQIEALIWMEWEALSSEEQRKCSIIEREESSDDKSPKKKGRPLKKSSDTPDSTMFKCSSCPASYRSSHSLGQHKRWCAGIAAANKGSSVLNKNSKEVSSPMKNNGDISFSCDGCKESFFDKRSLKIHKKFCSASTQTDSAVQSPASKSSALLSRKKSIQQDDTSSNGSKADSEDAPGIKRLKSRGPQLGSNTKRENICSKCESASDEEELVHCIGGCCASFHPRCLEEGAITSIVSFTCKLCKEDNHPCFICKKSSSNDDSLGEIKRCSVPKCGRSYHTTCLTERKIALLQHDDDDQKKQDKEKEKERQAILNSSKCTLHQCGTCTTKEKEDSNVASSNRCKMFRCIRCPTAFHIGDDCIAAGSILLPGLNIICPDHFEPLKTTPHHQPVHVSWCFVCSKGGQLMCCETCPAAFHPLCVGFPQTPEGEWFCRDCRYKKRPLYGEIVWVKLGSYRWWPGEITHPNEIPDNIQRLHHGIGEFVVRFFGSNDYFWLNKRRVFAYQEGDTGATSTNCSRGISSVFNKALQEAQESFEELMSYRQKLQDVKTQKKRPMYKHIKTNKPVGGVQIYTAELSEIARCICKKTDPNPCGPESECLNRMLMYECHSDLCPAGEKCQNQRFQKREYPSSEVFKTSWGGWALRAKDLIKKGEFVSEYVGELVDSEECMRRIEDAHKNNVTNFYMLTIDKDRIIDAGPKGNYSRFMNHSCDPNCETQKWMVNGDTRVGLFALREIQDGEELMFNYNLDCLGNDKTPCMCGSANCSGFIGVRPKPQMGENGNNGKSVKRKRRRQESKNVPKHDDFCFRCRQVGTLVCCDVRACQRAFCLRCLRLTKSPFGKWQCPWHHCDFCGRRAQNFCHFCPNSFCSSHVANQLLPSVPNKYDCCTDHDPNVAEYEMEEAIAAICASMLGPDGSSEIHDEDLESPSSAPEQEVLPDPKNVQMPSPKKAPVAPVPTLGVSTPPPRKRGRPRKNKTIETPVPKIPEPVTQEETLLSDAITESDDPEEEDDDEYLGPPTSSPYKMKRVKRSFYTGRKKKRRKSNAESAQSKNAKSSPGKNAKSSPLKNLQTIPQNNVESSPQNNAVSPTLNNDSPVKMDMRE